MPAPFDQSSLAGQFVGKLFLGRQVRDVFRGEELLVAVEHRVATSLTLLHWTSSPPSGKRAFRSLDQRITKDLPDSWSVCSSS